MAVQNGDTIDVDYTGTFEDGEEFDSSKNHGHPLTFTVGNNDVIKGFEDAVLGMEIGDEKTFTLTPDQAYGNVNEQLIQRVPQDQFPQDQEIEADMMFMLNLPEGQQVPATVTAVEEGIVTLDLNHPLAGKTLTFAITLVKIHE